MSTGRYRLRSAAFGLVLTALGVPPAAAQGGPLQQSCSVASFRTLVPPTEVPEAPRGFQPAFQGGDVSLGLGHLSPSAWFAFRYNWHLAYPIPVFDVPAPSEDEPDGWMVGGWLLKEGEAPAELSSVTRMVAAGESGDLSFLVSEQRPDGWIGIRVAPGTEGVWWTHECLLGMGEHPLMVEAWEARFSGDLFFFEEVEHVLHAEPSLEAEAIATIPGGLGQHDMRKLEVRGEWMRVSLQVPADRCGRADPGTVKTAEGWVRWRDPNGELRIFHRPGQC